MDTILNQIKNKLKTATIVEQVMFANIAVFVLAYLINAPSKLEPLQENPFFNWFALPENVNSFLSKPWTIVTYSFLHDDFWHIFFNLLLLFYVGKFFLQFFSKRDFLIYYFLGVVFGGFLFMIGYQYVAKGPETVNLVGASAGVTAVLIGIATKIPNYALRLRFIGTIKLWHIAVAIVLLDILQLFVSNTGGHLAHLGGAAIGFLLSTQLDKGKSLSGFFSKLFQVKKQGPLKTVYKKPNPVNTVKNSSSHQRKIDEILDKISKSGYETLTQKEKDFLFSSGKK